MCAGDEVTEDVVVALLRDSPQLRVVHLLLLLVVVQRACDLALQRREVVRHYANFGRAFAPRRRHVAARSEISLRRAVVRAPMVSRRRCASFAMLLLAAMANGFSSLPGDSIHQCLGNYPAEDFLVTVPTDNDGLYPVARCYKRCFEYRESQFTNGQ